jgi:hypothetical protein
METDELVLDPGDDAAALDGEEPASLHRHALNPVSLAFGILFLALGIAFSLGDVDMSDLSAGWIWAGASIAIGLLFLAAAVGRHRR